MLNLTFFASTFVSSLNFLLAQTPEQKRATLITVGILALIACALVFDAFGKESIVGKKKYKKVIMFFTFLILLVFVALYVAYRISGN